MPAKRFLSYVDRYSEGDEHVWGPPTWREHLDAVNALSELMERTAASSDPELFDHFKSVFDDAWAFLGRASNNWGARLEDSTRSSLAVLGYSASQTDKELELSSDEIEGLREVLEEIRQVVEATSELPDDIANRIYELINEILRLFNSTEPHFARVRSLSDELVGASMPVVALQEPGEQRARFFNKLMRVSGSWFSNASAGAAGGLTSVLVAGQLGL